MPWRDARGEVRARRWCQPHAGVRVTARPRRRPPETRGARHASCPATAGSTAGGPRSTMAGMLTTPHLPLADAIAGAVVLPGDPGWDEARSAFNLLLDQQPAAVAFPSNAQDVAAAIRYARGAGLRVAPQATAHNQGPLG